MNHPVPSNISEMLDSSTAQNSFSQFIDQWNSLFSNISLVVLSSPGRGSSFVPTAPPINLNHISPEQCEAIKQMSGTILDIAKNMSKSASRNNVEIENILVDKQSIIEKLQKQAYALQQFLSKELLDHEELKDKVKTIELQLVNAVTERDKYFKQSIELKETITSISTNTTSLAHNIELRKKNPSNSVLSSDGVTLSTSHTSLYKQEKDDIAAEMVTDRNAVIGRYVYKKFGGKPFFGFIHSYDSPYYKVIYEDADEEELEKSAILKYIWMEDVPSHKQEQCKIHVVNHEKNRMHKINSKENGHKHNKGTVPVSVKVSNSYTTSHSNHNNGYRNNPPPISMSSTVAGLNTKPSNNFTTSNQSNINQNVLPKHDLLKGLQKSKSNDMNSSASSIHVSSFSASYPKLSPSTQLQQQSVPISKSMVENDDNISVTWSQSQQTVPLSQSQQTKQAVSITQSTQQTISEVTAATTNESKDSEQDTLKGFENMDQIVDADDKYSIIVTEVAPAVSHEIMKPDVEINTPNTSQQSYNHSMETQSLPQRSNISLVVYDEDRYSHPLELEEQIEIAYHEIKHIDDSSHTSTVGADLTTKTTSATNGSKRTLDNDDKKENENLHHIGKLMRTDTNTNTSSL